LRGKAFGNKGGLLLGAVEQAAKPLRAGVNFIKRVANE